MKGSELRTPNRQPQEYSTNLIGTYLPGSLYWGFPVWDSDEIPFTYERDNLAPASKNLNWSKVYVTGAVGGAHCVDQV